MPTKWGTYWARVSAAGNTPRERSIYYSKRDLLQKGKNSPAYQEIIRNGKKDAVMVASTKVSTEYIINALPGHTFALGDAIEWKGGHWLVVEKNPNDTLYLQGRIQQCNHLFKWQNFNSEIIQCWGFVDSGVYSTTVTKGVVLSNLDKQYKILLPYNVDTEKLFIDKRLAIGSYYNQSAEKILSVYVITGIDNCTRDYNGEKLLELSIRSGAYNPERDNLEQEICDFIVSDGSAGTETAEHIIEFTYRGVDNIKIGGNSKEFTAIPYSVAGDVKNTESVLGITWTVNIPAGYSDEIHYTVNNNIVTLKADQAVYPEDFGVLLTATHTNGAESDLLVKVVNPLG